MAVAMGYDGATDLYNAIDRGRREWKSRQQPAKVKLSWLILFWSTSAWLWICDMAVKDKMLVGSFLDMQAHGMICMLLQDLPAAQRVLSGKRSRKAQPAAAQTAAASGNRPGHAAPLQSKRQCTRPTPQQAQLCADPDNAGTRPPQPSQIQVRVGCHERQAADGWHELQLMWQPACL